MLDHALIQARSVSVVFTVHFTEIVAAIELDQTASIAASTFYKQKRAFSEIRIRRVRERASELLDSEIENLHQIVVPADSAGLNRVSHAVYPLFADADCIVCRSTSTISLIISSKVTLGAQPSCSLASAESPTNSVLSGERRSVGSELTYRRQSNPT